MTGKDDNTGNSAEKYTFSYDELRDFLTSARGIAKIGTMRDAINHPDKFIILRQDIDLDFSPSFEVMKLQRELGITSTFFVLTSAYTYNPQTIIIREMLKEMAESGFEIGLHFDPSIYGNIGHDELVEKLEMECKILEEITGVPVTSISLHNPSISGEYPQFEGYLNAYSEEFFADERYISDSMRVDSTVHPFRGKNPHEFIRNAEKFPLQIVLHPEQFLEAGGTYEDTIKRYLSDLEEKIMREYNDTLTIIRRDRLFDLK